MPVDSVSIVEACYDVDLADDREWLAAVVKRVAPLVQCSGIVAYTRQLTADGAVTPIDFFFDGDVGGASEDMMRGVLGNIPAEMARTFATIPCLLGREAPFAGRETIWPMLEQWGIQDCFVLNAANPSGHGVFIGGALPKRTKLGPRQRETWGKVAAHVASAYRLRRRLRAVETRAEGAEAIVDPRGKVADAEAPAKSTAALAALKTAAVAVERARGKLRRTDTHAAIDGWHGLIAARWTLIEHFENDGKRFLLAKRNEAPVATLQSLTPRELQAVAFASLGHTNKLIAYEMGISASTVGVLLSRAAKRIGVKTRDALLAAFTAAQR